MIVVLTLSRLRFIYWQTMPRKKEIKPKQLPSALQQEVLRIAEELVQEKFLEARKIAAIEVANKLLARCADLLAVAGGAGPNAAAAALVKRPPPKPVVILNPCVICGQTGRWQDKTGRGGKPWYCEVHAGNALLSAREEATSGGLLNALKNAAPINDGALPE